MNLNEITSIGEYNKFLSHLNPFGMFQKKITLITVLYWVFSGFIRTIIDKQVVYNTSDQLPFLSLSIVLGLFFAPCFAYYYNRKITIIVLAGIFLTGAALLISCPNEIVQKISIYFISFSQYSICLCASCIVFQYVSEKLIPILAWTFIFSFHLAKFSSILILSQIDDHSQRKLILSLIILIFALLSLGGSFFFKESLRYLIDNDISQAEALVLEISQENNCTQQRILNIIQGSFIWSKVNIKKYGISSFSKYRSLARQIYYLGFSFFCLGIFGKFAFVIFEANQKKRNGQFQHSVQLLWISIFQLLGYFPGIILYHILERRKICLISSIIALVFSLILVLLIKQIAVPHFLIAAFSLLGLNSFLESVLFFFMFLQAIEFFPHTIRTFALSLCLCFYFLGQLAFNLHFYIINDEQSSFELVFCCSFSIILHLYSISQTLGKGIQYQIKQIQEREHYED